MQAVLAIVVLLVVDLTNTCINIIIEIKPPPEPIITYESHEERDNMINQSFSFWPHDSAYTLLDVDEGTNELRVINISSVQEDQGMVTFRTGYCGKFPQAVSIESKQHPGKFWRHQEGKIKIQEPENTDDICFNVVKAGCIASGSFSLQAANCKIDKFVQKCGDKVELRNRYDNCGDVKNMCWTNPVSEQASLAYCATNVTEAEDVYEYPECCNHKSTSEKFGACCIRENIPCSTNMFDNVIDIIQNCRSLYRSEVTNLDEHTKLFLKKNQECCHSFSLYLHLGADDYCQNELGIVGGLDQYGRKKRGVAACNMPCWTLNYCPKKMRQHSGWAEKFKNCCCHPYRVTMAKYKLNYLGNCPGLP